MKILITGICGFVGSRLAAWFRQEMPEAAIFGIDNFCRPGSERNRERLRRIGVKVSQGDLRSRTDLEALPAADWVIDAAAMPSVLAGIGGAGSSLGVMEHNLFGTVNLLEYCKSTRAGLILISTSRVYSIAPLAALPCSVVDDAFTLAAEDDGLPPGVTAAGVDERFSTVPPVSLYGATKLASELIAQEYAAAFGFPLRINRCGVMAGAGQFGRADQGIAAYWIHSFRQRQPLKYIGFGGNGYQVRDLLHPDDLAALIRLQMNAGTDSRRPVIANVSGGMASAFSLKQLTRWCEERFGSQEVTADSQVRPFDLPWVVLNAEQAKQAWNWAPRWTRDGIFDEIAAFAEQNPDWLEISR